MDRYKHRAIQRALSRMGLSFLVVIVLLSGFASSAFSQDSGKILAYGLQSDKFPSIQFNLELYDSQSNFVPDLKPADLALTEDSVPVANPTLQLLEPGLEVIAALNSAPSLASTINDAPQIDQLRQGLTDWAGAQADNTTNDYTFSTNTGLQIIRSHSPAQWAKSISDYQPDLARAEPGLFSLSTALDLTIDQPADARVKRAILFITPPLAAKALTGLDEMTQRAVQSGVRVFIWVAVPVINATPPDVSALETLANQTGGKLALVAGKETFPQLESWFAPLRKIYQVQYLSQLKQSGQHQLSIQISRASLSQIAPATLAFPLKIIPPNPIFLSPPETIQRSWSAATSGQLAALTPQNQILRIVIEFPDGFKRPLKSTRLFQDGVLVAENKVAPFDQFVWDLRPLTADKTASLRVEVEDTLGLTGSSIITPIAVISPAKPSNSILSHISRQGIIAVGAVVSAGLALGLILLGENRLRKRRRRGDKRRMDDPVTQPVAIPQDIPLTRTLPGESRPQASPTSPAHLIRVTDEEQPVPGSMISINRHQMTFGSDSKQVVIHLDDPSVAPLHARMLQNPKGGFILIDEGSVAGTWVNYDRVPSEGAYLEHLDLINFGRVTYRFELTAVPARREPIITVLKGPQQDEAQ